MAEAKKAKTASESKEAKEPKKAVKVSKPKEKEVSAVEAVPLETVSDKSTAKAGKRSAKSLKEAEEKAVKEARKTEVKDEASSEESPKPKKVQKPARSRLERRGKKFRQAAEKIKRDQTYPLKEALELAVQTSPTKFDATVELHVNLAVDPRQADQNIRGTVNLPSGSGKTIRIAVFADGEAAAAAKKAGADLSSIDEITKQLDKGSLDFDVLIAPPTHMAQLGKYAKLLGPRGLMPNPKSGTVTPNVAKAVSEAKSGKVEYRVDSTGIIHLGIGKVSFGADKLVKNTEAIMASVRSAKPNSIKGIYLKSAYVTTTMGPSIQLQLSGEQSTQ